MFTASVWMFYYVRLANVVKLTKLDCDAGAGRFYYESINVTRMDEFITAAKIV